MTDYCLPRTDHYLPPQPQAWYLVCGSADVKRGRVISRDFMGHPVVIFRAGNGSIHALAAHCSHLGTHLGRGEVVGDCLRCPLHHWEYDGQGICRSAPAAGPATVRAHQFAFPTVERYGGVFLFAGPTPLSAAPSFSLPDTRGVEAGIGKPVSLRCSWAAVSANGFDIQHLETVHERTLLEPPRLELLEGSCFRLSYVSCVTGQSGVDRTMRWLSGNHVAVQITSWAGSVITVESNLGRARSMLLLGLLPTAEGVQVTPIFGVRRTGIGVVDMLGLNLAHWLFSGFIRRDVVLMEGMQFHPRLCLPQDKALGEYLEFLHGLAPVPLSFSMRSNGRRQSSADSMEFKRQCPW